MSESCVVFGIRNHEIAVLYKLGMSLREIGEQYNLSQEGVRKILSRMGVNRRPKTLQGRRQREAYIKGTS